MRYTKPFEGIPDPQANELLLISILERLPDASRLTFHIELLKALVAKTDADELKSACALVLIAMDIPKRTSYGVN